MTFLVHRSRPGWLDSTSMELRSIDLDDAEGLQAALAGHDVLINLLRPDGSGWYPDLLHRLKPVFAASQIKRCVHASSIDVYSRVTVPLVDETTPPHPLNAYEAEHLAAEQILSETFRETVILRLGAVFGPGGRNVVSLAREMRSAPGWKLAARRALYGDRRMHLVSVQTAASALARVALRPLPSSSRIILVTEDAHPQNNFGFVQDSLAKAFSRRSLSDVPSLPKPVLRLLMRMRKLPAASINRRFSSERACGEGIDASSFVSRLEEYARLLAADERETAP